jgi:hypothetical protein
MSTKMTHLGNMPLLFFVLELSQISKTIPADGQPGFSGRKSKRRKNGTHTQRRRQNGRLGKND